MHVIIAAAGAIALAITLMPCSMASAFEASLGWAVVVFMMATAPSISAVCAYQAATKSGTEKSNALVGMVFFGLVGAFFLVVFIPKLQVAG